LRQAPDFDGLAGIYRWMEWLTFGPWLWRCRCAHLGELQSRRSALLLGDGDGRFTARLLNENHSVVVDAIDASPAMLAALMRRAGSNGNRVRTRAADLRAWQPEREDYDLIVTHFLLDCLTTEEIAELAAKLWPHLGPDCVWVVSEFSVPPGWFGRIFAFPLVSALYRAFRLLTGLTISNLPNHRAALGSAGFAVVSQRTWLRGLLSSELWVPANVTNMLKSTG
jgi:SAM-dependent methyltransferase